MEEDLLSEPKRWRARTGTQTTPWRIHWPPAAFPVVALGAPGVGPISYRPARPRRGDQQRARAPQARSPLRARLPASSLAGQQRDACRGVSGYNHLTHGPAFRPPTPILTILSEVTPSARPGELRWGGGTVCLSTGPKLLICRVLAGP